MALGKNLKKQKLIPGSDKPEKGKAAKKTKKKQVAAARKSKVSTTKVTSKAKRSLTETSVDTTIEKSTTIEDQMVVTPLEPPATEAAVPHPVMKPTKYVSEAEYKERQRLKSKFEQEIKALAGRNVHLIVFRQGSGLYALEIDRTREVVVTPPVTRTPHAPAYVKGVTSIRGLAMVVLDLAQKFNLYDSEEQKERSSQYTMVIESDRYNVGILVEEVPTTLIVEGGEISSATGFMSDTALDETYIKGIIEKDDQMIFFIDIDELVEGDKVNIMPDTTSN